MDSICLKNIIASKEALGFVNAELVNEITPIDESLQQSHSEVEFELSAFSGYIDKKIEEFSQQETNEGEDELVSKILDVSCFMYAYSESIEETLSDYLLKQRVIADRIIISVYDAEEKLRLIAGVNEWIEDRYRAAKREKDQFFTAAAAQLEAFENEVITMFRIDEDEEFEFFESNKIDLTKLMAQLNREEQSKSWKLIK